MNLPSMEIAERLAPAAGGDGPLAMGGEAHGAKGSTLRFCAGVGADPAPQDFLVPLERLSPGGVEAWSVPGAAEPAIEAGIKSVRFGSFLLCEASTDEAEGLVNAAERLYSDLVGHIAAQGCPHIVKAWNYLPRINQGTGDDERYKRFCLGRAQALDRHYPGAALPAGTAVGSGPETRLQVTLLASDMRPRPVENPRQVSAFHYPRKYGPRSPSFSRAAVIGEQVEQLLFVSGTAAIVGHASMHPMDLAAQVNETLNNWTALCAHAGLPEHGLAKLAGHSVFRAYLRRPEDLAACRALLEQAGIPGHRVLFLKADICRHELLFELDGILQLNR